MTSGNRTDESTMADVSDSESDAEDSKKPPLCQQSKSCEAYEQFVMENVDVGSSVLFKTKENGHEIFVMGHVTEVGIF